MSFELEPKHIYMHVDYAGNDTFISRVFYDKEEQKAHKWNFILPNDARLELEQSKKFVPMYIDKNGNLIGQTAPANIEDNPVVVVAKLKR